MSYRTTAYAAALVVSGAAGWFARAPAPAMPNEPAPLVMRMTPAQAAASTDATPLIAVSSDGNVTLRVEQQPLEWVLEQIAAQSGWADVQARARPSAVAAAHAVEPKAAAPAPATASCAPPPIVDVTAVLRTLERDSEAERFESLLRARSDEVPLPEPTLKWLYETDASERVRAAAFESYLELRADHPDALRETLEAALHVPSAAIRREAKQRLDVLHETQRLDALPSQGGP